MLLKAPDDKTARLTELDRLAKVAPLARRRQIAEEKVGTWYQSTPK